MQFEFRSKTSRNSRSVIVAVKLVLDKPHILLGLSLMLELYLSSFLESSILFIEHVCSSSYSVETALYCLYFSNQMQRPTFELRSELYLKLNISNNSKEIKMKTSLFIFLREFHN